MPKGVQHDNRVNKTATAKSRNSFDAERRLAPVNFRFHIFEQVCRNSFDAERRLAPVVFFVIFMNLLVEIPSMPKGVQHRSNHTIKNVLCVVEIPSMPKGVQHNPIRSIKFHHHQQKFLRCRKAFSTKRCNRKLDNHHGRNSFDAERRLALTTVPLVLTVPFGRNSFDAERRLAHRQMSAHQSTSQQVEIPSMPKGVQHQLARVDSLQYILSRNSFDAERRLAHLEAAIKEIKGEQQKFLRCRKAFSTVGKPKPEKVSRVEIPSMPKGVQHE